MFATAPYVDPPRRTALIVGVLMLLTFVTAIAARVLFDPVRDASNYITGADADFRIGLGGVFEVALILVNVGTALYLFPILKRQHEALASGFVGARLVECIFIAIGLVSLMAVVLLRQDLGGAAIGIALVGLGHSLWREERTVAIPERRVDAPNVATSAG